ncbi:unnamed protein product [Darwinula stevensoni]|uniref:Uncharacterized protein n=1 Tax=Darwinula stevensoni TaxID=69355 RepID=A0A7R9AED1_9CRUS|nr:unnamed protein product [Darwinula stevensoni]CAG0902221.1 unnamed protein product [Darwinula stevensoni]
MQGCLGPSGARHGGGLRDRTGALLIPYSWLEYLLLWLVPFRFRCKDVSGQVVLVTGGASGIGRIMCLRFSRLNCKVVTWDVDAEGNKETVNMIQSEGGTAHAYKVDLCNREEIYKTAKRVEEEVGKVTILVNNAGFMAGNRFLDCPDAIIQRTMDVNAISHFWETVNMIQSEGGTAHAYKVDLCNREEIYKTAKRVEEEVGKVTILVNNAGFMAGNRFLDCPDAIIQRTMDVNAISHFWVADPGLMLDAIFFPQTTKAFLPEMLKMGKGHVVTVASLGGFWGINRLVDYCASKFAAVGFDEALRTELKMDGHRSIKTTVVNPFLIDTPMSTGITSRIIPALKPEDVVDKIMSGVLTNQEMVFIPGYAPLVLFLKATLPNPVLFRFLRAFGAGEALDGRRSKGK